MSVRSAMTVADRETFLALRRVLPATTKVCLRGTFGISETTWVKLRDGRPVKASTLERVLDRYRALCGYASAGETPFDSPSVSAAMGHGYRADGLGRTSTMEPSGA
ncbi:hypothetical protein [Caulobacter sp. BE254]|uniref:hypothetical protein n=1 Tax=Caulobacter sp. BE254 TaxID=2817720 RepID=UPI00285C19A1|nr:hypothetical protein [Caulobacter sp. BE254]MDR7114641.1 hypothetical protein [Caulobacter sp. BE254]